jgi:hypothetical protein
MGISEGALFELHIDERPFTYTKLIDFEDAPEALAVYKDQLLVASFRNFYVVQNFKKESIVEDAFWSGLYPNSIAVFDDENVFIGIRGGIVKLDLINRTLKFYKSIQ